MKDYRSLRWLWWVALGLVAAGACGEGGVVGGDCLPGFIVCEGSCVNPHVHARNCGECGNVCPDGEVCNDGECGRGGAGFGGASGAAGAAGEDGSSGGTNGTGGASGGNSATGGTGTGGFGTGGFGTGGLGTGGGSGGSGVGGGSGGAGVGGGSGGDGVGGGTGGAGTGGAGTGGAGTGGTQSGSGGVGGSVCLPPFNSPEACGDCETQCEVPSPICAPAGGGTFECVPFCEPPLANCDNACVDRRVDPKNCGMCGNVCPSGLCASGVCQGATAGHVVYICMNYAEVFEESAQTRLLGNSVFLAARNNVRILSYSDHARMPVMNATDRAIRWAADREGRGVAITRSANLNQIESDLVVSDYEVFLVYDQSEADTGELAAAGAQLADTLNAFTIGGGIVVVLSGAVGVAEMNEFATAAGLAAVGTETPYSSLAYVRASADVIGVNVVSPFQTLDASCTFATSETPSADAVFVVTDTAPGSGIGTPIVLHKVISP